jgi:ribA/ribD-fused uncharacterized protein
MITKFRGEFRWLSNFWPAPVLLDGWLYPTTEHAYQAGKVLDEQVRQTIRLLPSASHAKRFGKKIGRSIPFRHAWSDHFKIGLMRDLLRQKFTNADLGRRLIATGNEPLIESGHWHDRFWGRCLCSQCGGQGRNMLGVLLMELRQECREHAQVRSRAEPEGSLARAT